MRHATVKHISRQHHATVKHVSRQHEACNSETCFKATSSNSTTTDTKDANVLWQPLFKPWGQPLLPPRFKKYPKFVEKLPYFRQNDPKNYPVPYPKWQHKACCEPFFKGTQQLQNM
jgi:hypothetical protein